MRRCFLVCYDIADAKRLRQVFKICKGYGEHWQYSIFFCVLKPIDRVKLQTDLEQVLHQREDRLLLIDLGENETAARASAITIGDTLAEPLEGMVVL